MHDILINNDSYKLPAEWVDLTPDQLRYLFKITREEDLSLERVKVLMMLYCLRAKVSPHPQIRFLGKKFALLLGQVRLDATLRIGRKKYVLTPEDVLSLSDLFEFLIKKETRYNGEVKSCYLYPYLWTNPYPRLRVYGLKFTSPDDCLFEITFEQFMYMQTYLDAMQEDPKKINELLACLWYRGKSFDIERLNRDAALLRHLPESKKMVMFWFVQGSMIFLSEMFREVFSGEKSSIKHNVFDAQLRLLDTLANSDVTKKDAVRKGKLIDALYAIQASIEQKEAMEEKMRNR
jgi:hypothetical protein